jgi:hypothetical protein
MSCVELRGCHEGGSTMVEVLLERASVEQDPIVARVRARNFKR